MVSFYARANEIDNSIEVMECHQMVVHVVHGPFIRRRTEIFGWLSSCRRGGEMGSAMAVRLTGWSVAERSVKMRRIDHFKMPLRHQKSS